MKSNKKLKKRCMSILLSIALLMTGVPDTLLVASADATSATEADPGTADTWETMMGTDADGNRYAGRVWVDKSVYTDGQIATLNSSDEDGSTFKVALEDDEAFQVIFSALGSSMTTTTTSSSTGPMDVVIILDNSSSMGRYTNSATKYSRLEAVTDASNKLISQILSSEQNRLAVVTYSTVSTVILPLNYYEQNDKVLTLSAWNKGNADNSGGVQVNDGDGKMTASATVLNTTTKAGTNNTGFQRGTNLQSGIDAGMSLLNSASDTTNRVPVVIVLTDGVADTAVTSNWYNVGAGTYKQPSDNTLTEGVALSTLLNASYWKSALEDKYGKAAMVYGIGVDLADNSDAEIVMNPSEAFNASGTSTAKTAYSWFTDWQKSSSDITKTDSQRTSWTFNQLPSNSTITKEDVAANINYVDTYYDVSSANLEDTFNQIYEELSSGVFNPISSSTTVNGATGVKDTPLIYVDNIGQYMEIKEIQAVTLFGASYGVVKGADTTDTDDNVVHNYTVQTGTGTNPTTNEDYNTAEDIIITVTENADGTQKLQIKINQEILPIILEQVTDKTVSGVSTATINEMTYNPLRVYYTVGLDSNILLPNGEIDVSKIDSGYKYINKTTGEITFYSNAFGVTNTTDADGNTLVDNGDAHVGFNPSPANRYYYHQANMDIFTAVTAKDGSTIDWDADEYGVLYEEDKYDFTWLTYDKYNTLKDSDKVYTYVTYYRPTTSTTDAATAAEKVTYIVYTNWGYLKESVAFYDHNAETFINYDAAKGYVTGDEGYAIPVDKVAEVIAAYTTANPNADIYAMLGVGSLRTSRLHNMIVAKTVNKTETADNRYTPEYTYDTAMVHNDNKVVVWLGNNGKLTKTVETGIALTKQVTEAIGNADDTYALTVTVPQGVTATPVVKDVDGNDVTATYKNNVLTVNLKAGETVYISGIPAGTECTIGEEIQSGSEYYISSKTDTVIVPKLSDVLGKASQYVNATVTNAPNKYGNLTIVKDVAYTGTLTSEMQSALAGKEFTFTVDVGTALKGKSFDTYNTAGIKNDSVRVNDAGTFTVTLKDNESITIKGLPEGTEYTVTEKADAIPSGFALTSAVGESVSTDKVVSGTIAANDNDTAHFVNTYTAPVGSATIVVSGEKTLYGTSYTDQTFNFAVQKWNGSAYETVATTDTTNGDNAKILAWQSGDGETKKDTYSIGLELYDLALGTHYYRVVEVIPETPVVGMSYDSTVGRFRVTITDSGVNGTAEIKVEKYNDADSSWTESEINSGQYNYTKDFNNIYDVTHASVTIPVTKTLNNTTGVDISKDIFSFQLVRVDQAGAVITGNDAFSTTVTSDTGGNAVFQITGMVVGTYYYYLTEQIPADNDKMAGMTYDGTTYLVTVTVNGDGSTNVLSAEATVKKVKNATGESLTNPEAVNLNDISFTNTYNLTNATWTLNGTKVLNERSLKNGEFSFELYQTDASFLITNDGTSNLPKLLQTVTNSDSDGDGKFDNINFSEITYTQIGTYYYSVKEVIPTTNPLGGVTYDTVHYHVTVPVVVGTGENAGKLIVDEEHVVINKIGVNIGEAGKVVFVNAYKAEPATYTISGTKSLTGRAMKNGEFTFELYEGTEVIDTAKVDTTTNHTNGSFTFKTITYDTAGTYTYTVKEKTGAVDNGVDYDETLYTVTVTVEDNGGGKLSASANITNADITFENTYTAAPVSVPLTAKKILKGETLNTNAFAVELYETDHTFIVADGSDAFAVIGNDADGNFNFVDNNNKNLLTYSTPGTYFYVLREVPGTDMVYDSTVYQIRVVVSDNGQGQLVVDVTCYNGDLDELTFTNATFDEVTEKEVYLEGNTTAEIDGEKVDVGDILTYYITYTNYTGEDAVVDIMDTIPAHTTYVEGSASHNGSYAGTHLNWVLNVLKGESVTVSFEVKVDEAEAIMSNTAVIRDGINTYTTNEVTNHTVDDVAQKDVFDPADVTASIDGEKVNDGDTLLYTVSYTNTSDQKVNVIITDKLPEYTTYVDGTADNGGVYADGTLKWEISDVPAWSTITVSFKVMVDVDTSNITIANKADVKVDNNTYTTNEVTNDVIFEPDPTPTPDPVVTPDPDPTPTPTPTPGTDATPTPDNDGDEYKTYVFTKVWNDQNNAAGKRPSSIMVKLYCDGVYASDIELCEANNWTCSLILMSKNDGEEVEWTIEERDVPSGYSASYNQETHTVTNTYDGSDSVGTDGTRTGDDSNLALFGIIAVIALIALAGIAVLLIKFKKKDEHEE